MAESEAANLQAPKLKIWLLKLKEIESGLKQDLAQLASEQLDTA